MNETAGYEEPEKKLPFYMVFPFWDNRKEEEESERDADLLKSLYPEEARRIWPKIEEICDQLEYDGSIMFDEFPDQTQVRRKVLAVEEELQKDGMPMEQEPEAYRRRQDLIEMLFYQEMHRRRQCRRRFQRHFVY